MIPGAEVSLRKHPSAMHHLFIIHPNASILGGGGGGGGNFL